MTQVITLDTKCYTIKDGSIVEHTLSDFSRFIKETTSPRGVEPKIHVRENIVFAVGGREFETREEAQDEADDNSKLDLPTDITEKQVWELWTWGYAGNFPEMRDRYETEEEAYAAETACHVDDILENDQFMIYLDKESAEDQLKQDLEEIDE